MPGLDPDLIDRAALLRRWENLQAVMATSNVRAATALDVIRLIDAAPRAATEPTDPWDVLIDDPGFEEGMADAKAEHDAGGFAPFRHRVPPPLTRERLAAVRKVLTEWGIHETANQSLHGWRCTYPDRYPEPCGHFEQLMADVTAALLSAGDNAEPPRVLVCERNESAASAHGHTADCYR